MAMAASRDARAAADATGSPAVTKRGRFNERVWADVRIAARVAREEGVVLDVHGIKITGMLKQHKVNKVLRMGLQQQQAEAAVPQQPSATSDEASPPPASKRKQRSAQRLQEFQEKKRVAAVAELVAKGCDLAVAQATVARDERKRLEERSVTGAAPMQTETN